MKTYCLLLAVLLGMCLNIAVGQTQVRNVVYLKNGSIVKGIIIEQVPNKSVKLQTADGSVFVYNTAEIEKIETESTLTSIRDVAPKFGGLNLFGGAVIPVGDFASTNSASGGGAKLGYGFGGEFIYAFTSTYPALGLLVGYTAMFNGFDASSLNNGGYNYTVTNSGSWTSTAPMLGIANSRRVGDGVSYNLAVEIGALFLSTPEFTVVSPYGGGSVTVPSYSGSGVAVAIQFALVFDSGINIKARYFSAKPKITINQQSYEQSASMIQFFVGYVIN